MDVDFLIQGERLIRLHRFRLLRVRGCAWAHADLAVEEELGAVAEPERRCLARPDHPERVPRTEFTAHGPTPEAALAGCIVKIRGKQTADLFLPTA